METQTALGEGEQGVHCFRESGSAKAWMGEEAELEFVERNAVMQSFLW